MFKLQICVYNESFSPIGKGKGRLIAMLWQQGVAGRNDKDIVCCLVLWLVIMGPPTTKQKLDIVTSFSCISQ